MRPYKIKKKFRKLRKFKKRVRANHRFLPRSQLSIFKNRFFLDFILFFILGITLFYFFFLSEIFKIKEIKIVGPPSIPYFEFKKIIEKNLEKKFLNFFSTDSLFLIDGQEIEKEILKNYPEIKTAILKKKFPKTLLLEIEKREAIGTLCFISENCFFLDNQGIIFKIVSEPASNKLVKIFYQKEEFGKIGQKVIPEDILNKIRQINDNLKSKLNLETEKFTLKDNRLDVKTTESWELYFDLSADLELTLTKLQLLLEKEISEEERKNLQYIDLRFSKVYYK